MWKDVKGFHQVPAGKGRKGEGLSVSTQRSMHIQGKKRPNLFVLLSHPMPMCDVFFELYAFWKSCIIFWTHWGGLSIPFHTVSWSHPPTSGQFWWAINSNHKPHPCDCEIISDLPCLPDSLTCPFFLLLWIRLIPYISFFWKNAHHKYM